MARCRYVATIRIEGLTADAIRDGDPDLWAEVFTEAAPGDTDEETVLRWLGGLLSETEDKLNSLLPEGFYTKIEGLVAKDDS